MLHCLEENGSWRRASGWEWIWVRSRQYWLKDRNDPDRQLSKIPVFMPWALVCSEAIHILGKRQNKHIAHLWSQRMNQELFTVQLKASATLFCVFFSVCVNFHFAYNMRQEKQQNLENACMPPSKRPSHKDLCLLSKGLIQLSVSRAVSLFTVRDHCSHSAVSPRLLFESG